ncbi:MAG: glycoside hydrolase family 18 [Clostridia bacterium]|nr:glycoside hydrolase family 18 [Clostridia bacterium]
MRQIARRCAVLALAAVLLPGCTLWSGSVQKKPLQKPNVNNVANTTGRLMVLGFYDDRQEPKRGQILDTVKRNKDVISELAPFWYRIERDGSIIDVSENDVRDFARKNGIRLLPLVTNNNGNDAFLNDARARSRAISKLLDILDKNKDVYDGFSLDFQLLSPATRMGLTSFVSQLYPEIRKRGKRLNIDVIPAGQPDDKSSPYDYAKLAQNVDQIVLMTYDNHSDASQSGPIAPLSWVRQRVEMAIASGVKPAQLVLGVAAYGYDWIQGTTQAETIRMKDAEQRVKGTVQRASDLSPHFTYTDNKGRTHVVWYEDEVSVAKKVRLAKDMRLKGIAIWRLGYENQKYWDAIKANIQ